MMFQFLQVTNTGQYVKSTTVQYTGCDFRGTPGCQGLYEKVLRATKEQVIRHIAQLLYTQHTVGAGRGTGDGATRLTSGQHQDRGPAGDETHRSHSNKTELGLHDMGDRCRE